MILVLLERVFLRVGSAESDEQLQNVLTTFLPPVLLKLVSTAEGVQKKVGILLCSILDVILKISVLFALLTTLLFLKLIQLSLPFLKQYIINSTMYLVNDPYSLLFLMD